MSPKGHRCRALDRVGLGGAGAWSSTPADVPACAQAGTPCISEQLYAHDDQGTKLIDSSPPGTGNSIGDLNLSGNARLLSWSHDNHHQQLLLH